ncbi:hypothetical protein BDY19DRAFT_559929 [Irpex rosettiformis]|uniref:Uncharacterized protein n=1 Tax=Irpex rosettiformis TaxID=378272 RepID=A0ACB8TPZ9_9APHY|nr:hypothetical protein BDY19DRAFT_559929 [Irpex rosettiformis]
MPGDNKRKSECKDRARRRYRYDGTPIQATVSGPSVWVTCVRGKEKAAVGELYDLFEHYAAEMYPPEGSTASTSAVSNGNKDGSEDEDEDEDIEKQIAKEMSTMKRPRKETRFASCQTNTSCFVVISCRPPVDPIQLVVKHVKNVLKTGVTQTKFAQRLTPISATCVTNLQEIKTLCTRLLEPHLARADVTKFSYKIELRMRNHNSLSRPEIIEELAQCVPPEHKVNLEDPELFILVEIWKSVCGIGIVTDYYKLQKFNVMEIAKSGEPGFKAGTSGRVQQSSKAGGGKADEEKEQTVSESVQ